MSKPHDENFQKAEKAMRAIETYNALKEKLVKARQDGDLSTVREINVELQIKRHELRRLTNEV